MIYVDYLQDCVPNARWRWDTVIKAWRAFQPAKQAIPQQASLAL